MAICNSNFIQASFLEEYDIADYSNLLIEYYFSGSYRRITDEEKRIIERIEDMTLARRIAGSLMRFGNSTSIKTLLSQVENKTYDQLVDFAKENTLPTPLPLITGIKPGIESLVEVKKEVARQLVVY